jgi:hypothetical protein
MKHWDVKKDGNDYVYQLTLNKQAGYFYWVDHNNKILSGRMDKHKIHAFRSVTHPNVTKASYGTYVKRAGMAKNVCPGMFVKKESEFISDKSRNNENV